MADTSQGPPPLSVTFCHDHPDVDDFDPNPAETSRRDIELLTRAPQGAFNAIGWRAAGLRAAELAAAEPSKVARLVLCCVPAPSSDTLSFNPASITAKTLLLYGQMDEDAPPRDAQWWKAALNGARVEIVPRRGHDFIGEMWGRVLSHAAPRTLRPKNG